jgi:hypothetical protein
MNPQRDVSSLVARGGGRASSSLGPAAAIN